MFVCRLAAGCGDGRLGLVKLQLWSNKPLKDMFPTECLLSAWLTLRFSAASPDSKLIFQLSNPIMYFLSPVCMWEELRFCPARWGEPATQLMFSLIWVGWLTPPGWAESMFLSHKMSGKIKTSQEIKYIMGLLSWNINFESGDAAEILTVSSEW